MLCPHCQHDTYLIVCEHCHKAVPELLGTSGGRIAVCRFCGELNSAGFAFCSSCGHKPGRTAAPSDKALPHARIQSCWSCKGSFVNGIELCPFCGVDCRPLRDRALKVFGHLAAAAAFILVAIIPIYLYLLPGGTKIDAPAQVTAGKATAPSVESVSSTKLSATDSSNTVDARTGARPSKSADLPASSISAMKADREEEITSFLNRWISSFQARDLEQHLQHYGSQLSTYFTWRNVPHRSVEQDKRKFFSAYDQIAVMRIHDVRISATSATTAEAVFLKDWDVRGRGEFSGRVLQRLVLQRSNGKWQITSEEELKTLRRHKTRPAGLQLATFTRG